MDIVDTDLFPPGQTVDAARDEYFERAKDAKGCVCPVCDRKGKIHVVNMGQPMVMVLTWLYRQHNQNFVHVPSRGSRSVLKANCVGKMLYWGFVERKPNTDDPTKHHSGWYRITEAGIRFLQGRIKANKRCWTYNKQLWKWSEELITVHQANKKYFDFSEIMRETVRNDS